MPGVSGDFGFSSEAPSFPFGSSGAFGVSEAGGVTGVSGDFGFSSEAPSFPLSSTFGASGTLGVSVAGVDESLVEEDAEFFGVSAIGVSDEGDTSVVED